MTDPSAPQPQRIGDAERNRAFWWIMLLPLILSSYTGRHPHSGARHGRQRDRDARREELDQ